MAIHIRLSAILGERRIKMTELADGAGITRKTVWAWYHDKPKAIDLDTLDKICAYLGVTPGDLIVWKEDNNECSQAE